MCAIDEVVCRKGDDIRVATVLLEIMMTISTAVCERGFSCINREKSL